MAKMLWVAFFLGVGYFAVRTATFVRPEEICVLISLLFLIALPALFAITAIWGFKVWRRFSRFWVIPSLIYLVFGVAGFFWAPMLGIAVSDRIFERHVIEYSKVVDGLKSGAISCQGPCNSDFGFIETSSKPTNIKALLGIRCGDGGVAVLFLQDTDLILHHEGYLFRDYGVESNCSTGKVKQELEKYYLRHIAGPWYHFSD